MSQGWYHWSRNCLTTWSIVVSETNADYSNIELHFMQPKANVISVLHFCLPLLAVVVITQTILR